MLPAPAQQPERDEKVDCCQSTHRLPLAKSIVTSMQTPDTEVAQVVADVLARPQCLDPRALADIYRRQGLSVIPDPSATAISEQVIRALQAQQPLMTMILPKPILFNR
jgi:hypothetical protein